MAKGSKMKRIAGGSSIVERLNISENEQGGSYSGTDTFSNTPDETIDHAYYDFSKYSLQPPRNGKSIEKTIYIMNGDKKTAILNVELEFQHTYKKQKEKNNGASYQKRDYHKCR